MAKKPTRAPATLHPLSLTARQAQLIVEGLNKLGWATAEVREIVPALDELERVAALSAPPSPTEGA